MSIIKNIKDAQLAARKGGNKLKATLLTTLIGEAEIVGKNAGNRETTDSEVIAVLKKFEKGMIETIGYLKCDRESHTPSIAIDVLNDELQIIREFMPVKLTDLQIQNDINTVMQEQNLAKEQKSLGVVVKALKEKYGDQFDGQQVSTQFKGML